MTSTQELIEMLVNDSEIEPIANFNNYILDFGEVTVHYTFVDN